jgi:hypothetical protein
MQIKLFFTQVTMQSQPETALTKLEQQVNEWLKQQDEMTDITVQTAFVPSYILITVTYEKSPGIA